MRCIELNYRTSHAFHTFYNPPALDNATSAGSIFVRTLLPVHLGQEVLLDIKVESAMERRTVAAKVIEVPALLQVDGRPKRGARLAIDEDERSVIIDLLEAIGSDLEAFHARKLDRAGLRMEAESNDLQPSGAALPVFDVSPGGVFVVTPPRGEDEALLPIGQMIQLRLIAPDYAFERRVVGEVAWYGNKNGSEGMGVRFVFKTSAERREWRGIFTRLERQRQTRMTDQAMAQVRQAVMA